MILIAQILQETAFNFIIRILKNILLTQKYPYNMCFSTLSIIYFYSILLQIFFLLFILLYVTSFCILSYFKKKTGTEDYVTGTTYFDILTLVPLLCPLYLLVFLTHTSSLKKINIVFCYFWYSVSFLMV